MTKRSPKKQARPQVAKRPGQPGGVRDTNRKEKQRVLLDSALTLFLELGVSNVAVDDITSKAGVAKGSFYRYFKDQEHLVEVLLEPMKTTVVAAIERCRDQLENAITKEAQYDAYRTVGAALAGLVLEAPGVGRLYLQESRAPAVGPRRPIGLLSKQVMELAEQVSTVAQKHGVLKPLPIPVTTRAVVGAAERLFLGVLLEEDMGNVLEIPAALTTLIVDGLKA